MSILPVMLVFASIRGHVIAQTCPQGVCYGGAFKAKEGIKGQHLLGFSYKNLSTVRHAQGCFSACANECLCRSYQVSSTGCELLEEDKDSRTLKPNSDYIYFDLKQKVVPSASSLSYPSVCRNGCCLANPCLNGGTCTEKCEHPKTKFVCNCPTNATGKRCEQFFWPKSCLDFYKAHNAPAKPPRGVYTIFKNDNITEVKRYCDFTPPNKAWTLIESYAAKHRVEFEAKSFLDDYPVNQETPGQHEKYRLARAAMQMIKATAVSYRVTCKFLSRENVTDRDYLEGRLSTWDIIDEASTSRSSCCKTVTYVNIEGHSCSNCTLALFQKKGDWHFHAHPNVGYDLIPPTYKDTSKQIFGKYNPGQYHSFLGYDSPDSTTEYWLGQEMP
ncbi:uncharacterized protein LOC125556817 [Nematostella vectensis]|uniref:uncharacterized protein LOC125573503 n=1 Tax=Nematostella vectensis TaxID=45351 RepID=UPI002077766E|nr:uncharacterized protein LOC125573503 [Nematostella vectensis]XP_048589901.1 uncharacterized protein LOC125556817 [Nematostella vectensis]